MSSTAEAIRVLHVDDDPDTADLVATFLERKDDRLTVATETSASEGVERLSEESFDCVVSDYNMPERNGIQFLETVREEYPRLPFILFTGKGSEEIASEAISAGATDYLQKERGTEQYELLANRIRNAVEQYRTRRRAAELDRIRTLASDINQVLVRAESRTELERRVCGTISDSDPYMFAWIGDVDHDTDRIEPRASAGIEDGYLEEITVTTDEASTGYGPGGTAVRERRLAVSQNVADDPEFEPWRDEALERGYRAAAAVPLEYEETLYGVLVVYSGRPHAFDEDERQLLAELGDDIAHALHSFEVRNLLREERDQRRALFENAPGPVIAAEIHEGGDVVRMAEINDAFTDVFGYERDEVVGKDPAELIVPDDRMDEYAAIRERATAGETFTTEVERFTTDGLRTFVLHIIPYGAAEGHADGLYAWFTDITHRQEREQAIQELHTTTDALMDAETAEDVAEIATTAVRDILKLPANGVHLYDEGQGGLVPVAWTERTEEMVGVPPTFTPGEGIAGTAFETGEPQIYDDISTVSERYNPDTDIRSQIVLPLDGYGVLVIGSPEPGAFDDVDVSLAETLAGHATTALERIERENELERYETFVETAAGGVFAQDENGQYTYVNSYIEEKTGYDREEIIGQDPSLLMTEDEIEEIGEEITEMLKGDRETVSFEAEFTTATGEIVPAEGQLALLPSDDGFAGTVGMIRDITDRRERERELERQNERLEEFARVVSHDLRNPLAIAAGRLELAREECDSAHLEDMAAALDRMDRLTENLLALAREGKQVDATEPVELAETVEGCWRNVETADAALAVETDRTIQADPSRVEQLLENLIRNAVEHGSTSPRSQAREDTVEHGGEEVTVTVGALDDGFFVEDDGPGIPQDDREQVFESGYSTSEEGTGFGLSIVKEVAEAHGWDVRVTESAEGGARFEFVGVDVGRD